MALTLNDYLVIAAISITASLLLFTIPIFHELSLMNKSIIRLCDILVKKKENDADWWEHKEGEEIDDT